MATVFLSHSSKNERLARTIETWLQVQGFDDLFVDFSSINAGDKWTDALRRAKGSCRVVLCLVTPDWLASDECYGEFVAGWYSGRRMIPLLAYADAPLDDKQKARLARVLGEDQGVDLSRAGNLAALDLDNHPQISEPLKSGLRAAGALARAGLDPYAFEVDRLLKPEPFPGLESFDDSDADAAVFFGRSPEIAQCLEDLREMRASGDRRPYVLLGASGSGKSSVLKAGVLPRIRRERAWLGLRSFRPGADPLLNFSEALVRSGVERASGAIRDELFSVYRAKGDLRGSLDTLLEPLRQKLDRATATVLISLDQGEELARADGESGDCLGELIKSALAVSGNDKPAAYALVLTVRSDCFQELQASPRFEHLKCRTNDIRTLPVYRFDTAVEQPAQRYGVEVEAELTEALMEDAGGKDALPLLAFSMQRLWRHYAAEKRMRRAHYESLGKLAGLLENAAERALRGLDPLTDNGSIHGKISDSRDKVASRVFVPALAKVNERGVAVRRIAKWDAFDDDAQTMIGWFDKWRLIVRKRDTVEVTHESLFREWPRFRRWLDAERKGLQTLEGLERAAASWAAKQKSSDELLHLGPRLRDVRRVLKEPQFKAQIESNEDVKAYLLACAHTITTFGFLARFGTIAAIVIGLSFALTFCSVVLVDGQKSIPLILGVFAISIVNAVTAIALFMIGILLRSLAKSRMLNVNSDKLLLGAAALCTVALCACPLGFMLYEHLTVEQLGARYKAEMLISFGGQPGLEPFFDTISMTGEHALGWFAIFGPLSHAPIFFAYFWVILLIWVLIFSPVIMPIRYLLIGFGNALRSCFRLALRLMTKLKPSWSVLRNQG